MDISNLISEFVFLTNPDTHPAARMYIEQECARNFDYRSAQVGPTVAMQELQNRIATIKQKRGAAA